LFPLMYCRDDLLLLLLLLLLFLGSLASTHLYGMIFELWRLK
jgi:hypothetical protein